MTTKIENEQIFYLDRIDNLRKELESKIEKVENKAFNFLMSIVGILVILLPITFGYLLTQINANTSQINETKKVITLVSTNVAIAETKINLKK